MGSIRYGATGTVATRVALVLSPPMRVLVSFLSWVSLAALLGCGGEVQRRPDVILIVVDTLRADAVLDPGGHYQTPSIDALAADGVSFSRAFAHAPMTLPAHTSLFSSRPPLETGVVNNGQKVPEDLPLLAEWLSRFGYDARAVTSLGTLRANPNVRPGLARGFAVYDVDYWHIDPAENVLPRMQAGLDAWSGSKPLFFFGHFCDPHEPYDSHDDTGRVVNIRLNGKEIGTVSSENMTRWRETVSLTPGRHEFELRAAEEFRVRYFTLVENGAHLDLAWENEKEKPARAKRAAVERTGDSVGDCELTIWVNDVLSTAEVRKRYAEEVAHVDRYVGRLIDDLKARGLYDDSLVVFTSDHGEALGEHGMVGHVQNLTDDMIRVPLIVKPPKKSELARELGAAEGRVVRHVDLVPTILEIVGVPPLPGQTGTSLLAQSKAEIIHLAQTHKPEAQKDKLSLFDGRYKMIYTLDDDAIRMYDLVEDPQEKTDLFATQAELRPDWPEQLRRLARVSVELARTEGELDPETKRQLDALGY